MLMLHGFNGELANWDDVWKRLADEPCDARRVRLDLPGFGGSDWNSEDYGLSAQAARVIEFMDTLGIEEATLIGTSMGGSLAAWLAAEYPTRIRQRLLLAPSGYPGSLYYPGFYGALVKPGLLNQVTTWIARTGLYRAAFPRSKALQALTVTAGYGQLWADALARIEAPTVVAWSAAISGSGRRTLHEWRAPSPTAGS